MPLMTRNSHRDVRLVRMLQSGMASGLVVDIEPGSLKGMDNPFRFKNRQF